MRPIGSLRPLLPIALLLLAIACESERPLGPGADDLASDRETLDPAAELTLAAGTAHMATLIPGLTNCCAKKINASGDVLGSDQVILDGVLHNLPGFGRDINVHGHVAGDMSSSGGDGFLWIDGVTTFFRGPNGEAVQVKGMNDNGQIVGTYSVGSSGDGTLKVLSFVWSGGVSTAIPAISATSCRSLAQDINNAGQVVGYGSMNPGSHTYPNCIHPQTRGFRYSATGGMEVIPAIANGSDSPLFDDLSQGLAINEVGVVAGFTKECTSWSGDTCHDNQHVPFTWDGGALSTMSAYLGCGLYSEMAINASSDVVGSPNGSTCGTSDRALLWRGGMMIELPFTTSFDASPRPTNRALGINDAGEIVGFERGYVNGSGGQTKPVIWREVPTCFGRVPTIIGTGAPIEGTAGSDVILGTAGPDRIYGRAGADFICGLEGDDRIVGHGGNDQIQGNDGADIIKGGPGKDWIWGDGGDDQLFGGRHHDRLYGGPQNDKLFGDAGSDRLYGHSGDDDLDGGADSDPTCEGHGGTNTIVNCP